MIGRALIEWLRGHIIGPPLSREQQELLADAVEIADEAAKREVRFNTLVTRIAGVRWHDTQWALDKSHWPEPSRLDYAIRRGLIERHPERPELVRFVEDGK